VELRGLGDPGLARAVIGVWPRIVWAALAGLTSLRLGMAATVPLAPDEAYYWVWSRALSAGYFDHPPMVAYCVRVGTWLVGENPLGVRLLGPLGALLSGWMLADAAERLFPGRGAGPIAGALFHASLFVGVGAVIMTPDSPLLFFWIATLWALVRAMRARGPGWWIVAGLAGGGALASKYTAAFLGLGVGLWLLLPAMRPVLGRPGPWLGLGAALLVFSPVLIWNLAHDGAGFARQGGRIGAWELSRGPQFLAELIGAQAGLATPLVWVLCLAGLAVAAREVWRRADPGWGLLACLGLPGTLYFTLYALGARVQGNWLVFVYPAAFIAAAGLTGAVWVRLRGPAVGLGLGIGFAAYLHATTWALPMPVAVDPIALRLAGWDAVRAELTAAAGREGASFVAADQYALAAALAWTLPADMPVAGVEDRWALFALPRALGAGPVGILVRDSRERMGFDSGLWSSAEKLGEINRGNVQTLQYFRVTPTRADLADAVWLPRPE
jgi:4-amino-4-deoxy-L-arabinose transferase-like glycosyltransferase